MNLDWHRVTKADPCAVCGRPDWCTTSAVFHCCMRVESSRPCEGVLGGWLHFVDTSRPLRPLPAKVAPPPTIDAPAVMARFNGQTFPEMVAQFAAALGVSVAALDAIGCAWAVGHSAWAFPMKDWQGNTVGIRLRNSIGDKWAVKGSRAGLFYAEGQAETVYVCEGPTDTAAALTIGLDAIGRPSCLGSEAEVNWLLKRKGARRAVIVSDNDEPGWRGASKLADSLSIPSVVWVPPVKDLREFVGQGGTRVLIESLTNSLVWNQPKNEALNNSQIVAKLYQVGKACKA